MKGDSKPSIRKESQNIFNKSIIKQERTESRLKAHTEENSFR